MIPKFDFHSRLALLYLIIGEKPGANLMFIDESKKPILLDIIDKENLSHRCFQTEIHEKMYLTRSEERFEKLKPVEEGSPYHTYRSEGDFLGYPKEAVECFVEQSGRSRSMSEKLNEKIDDMLEKGKVHEKEVFNLDFILYVPELTEEGIMRGIAEGKRRKKVLKHFDKKQETDLGRKYIQEVFEKDKPRFRELKD